LNKSGRKLGYITISISACFAFSKPTILSKLILVTFETISLAIVSTSSLSTVLIWSNVLSFSSKLFSFEEELALEGFFNLVDRGVDRVRDDDGVDLSEGLRPLDFGVEVDLERTDRMY